MKTGEEHRIATKEIHGFIAGLTSAQTETTIRHLMGVPKWVPSMTPRELAELLLEKLDREDPGEALGIITGAAQG